ncbi:MAG: tetratricopeptide repeat protein [Alphaproteobacteria bacterium]
MKPAAAGVHNNLGASCPAAGLYEKALAAFDQALRLDPTLKGTLINRTKALLDLGRKADGLAEAERCVAAMPETAEAHILWAALNGLGSHEAALEKAIALDAGNATSINLVSYILRDAGRAIGGNAASCRAVALRPDLPIVHSNLLLGLNYESDARAEDVFSEHRRWAERHADPLTRTAPRHSRGTAVNRRPLRVGYVSPTSKPTR